MIPVPLRSNQDQADPMNRNRSCLLFLLASLGLPVCTPAAPLDLLGGRLSIELPEGAKLEARQASIMAAPESSLLESRVVYDEGEERLVLMAREVHATPTADFDQTLAEEARKWSNEETSFAVSKLAPVGGLQVAIVTPSKLDPSREAVFTRQAICVTHDRHVVRLTFYINPRAATKRREYWEGVIAKALKTLQAGKRSLNTTGGRLVLKSEDKVGIMETIVALPAFGENMLTHVFFEFRDKEERNKLGRICQTLKVTKK